MHTVLQIGKLYIVPFLARYDNANVEDRTRCDQIVASGVTASRAPLVLEYDRLRLVLFAAGEIVMVIEADPTRKIHPGDTAMDRNNHMYLKLLVGGRVVEVYASKSWVNGFTLAKAAI